MVESRPQGPVPLPIDLRHQPLVAELLPVFGRLLLIDIEAEDVERYQTQRVAAGAAAATVSMDRGPHKIPHTCDGLVTTVAASC